MTEKILRNITITGSEGLLGTEIAKHFEKNSKVQRLDLKLGHDLTDEKFVKKWFKENPTNYLVNCFALNDHGKTKSTMFNFNLNNFQKYLEVNVISLFAVCREFARSNNKGGIVNFSSVYGEISPRPDMYGDFHKDIGYCVSKAGVINLTKYLAVHLAPKIQVNCIIPGGIGDDQPKKFANQYSKLTPMKRMMAKNELNGMIDFLCSKESEYVTGASFVVDGGFTAW